MKNKFILLCFLILVIPGWAESFYPKVDTSTGWSVLGYSDGALSGVKKRVLNNSSGSYTDKTVFNKWSFEGVKLNGVYYTKSQITFDPPVSGYSSSGQYHYYYNYFYVNSSRMYVVYYLYYTGEFKTLVYNYDSSVNSGLEVFWRVDYDLDGYNGDMFEDAVNKSGKMVLDANFGEGQTYHPAQPVFNEDTIENNWFGRAFDGSSQGSAFGAVFWWTRQNALMVYRKAYASDEGQLPPSVNVFTEIQDVSFDNQSYPDYAYSGRDQMIWVKASVASASSFGFGGKVFQKPNGRPVNLKVNIMTGGYVPDLNYVVDNNRSVADVLDDLTGGSWTSSNNVGLSNPYGSDMTKAELHAFMLANRSLSDADREEVTSWRVDVNIVYAKSSEYPTAYGLLFDYGSGDFNYTEREGVAVFYKTIADTLPVINDRKKMTLYTLIHEVGHAFNFNHSWSTCGSSYATCSNGSIMSYSFNPSGGTMGDTTMSFDSSVVNFYQNAPEGWVKPGRYGAPFISSVSTNPPSFINLQ